MASNGEDISNNLDDIRKVLTLILTELARFNEREESILAHKELYGSKERA